jgi:hypothetical protein
LYGPEDAFPTRRTAITEPGYWHRRAGETRALAKQMSSERSKEMMLKIADAYDRLAVRAALS